MWIVSVSGQAIFLILLWANELWKWSAVLPVVLLFLDVFVFGLGLGPLPWFVVPELFPDDVRSAAMGAVQAANWAMAALMIFVFPTWQDKMTLAWVYFFYGIIMVLATLYGLFLLTETRGVEMGALDGRTKLPNKDHDPSSLSLTADAEAPAFNT
jgi:MFS family permease